MIFIGRTPDQSISHGLGILVEVDSQPNRKDKVGLGEVPKRKTELGNGYWKGKKKRKQKPHPNIHHNDVA